MTNLHPDLEALMPEPVAHIHSDGDFCWDRKPSVEYWPESLYTATQMREAILAATERAAKVAEAARDEAPVYRDEYDICNELAAAIRGTK